MRLACVPRRIRISASAPSDGDIDFRRELALAVGSSQAGERARRVAGDVGGAMNDAVDAAEPLFGVCNRGLDLGCVRGVGAPDRDLAAEAFDLANRRDAAAD